MKGEEKVGKVMSEFKQGSLRSSSGAKVTDRKQAIAIGLSEARRAGAKVPKKKEMMPPQHRRQMQKAALQHAKDMGSKDMGKKEHEEEMEKHKKDME